MTTLVQNISGQTVHLECNSYPVKIVQGRLVCPRCMTRWEVSSGIAPELPKHNVKDFHWEYSKGNCTNCTRPSTGRSELFYVSNKSSASFCKRCATTDQTLWSDDGLSDIKNVRGNDNGYDWIGAAEFFNEDSELSLIQEDHGDDIYAVIMGINTFEQLIQDLLMSNDFPRPYPIGKQ